MRLALKNNKRIDVLTIVVIHYLEAVARRCSTQNVFLKFQKSYCKNPVPVACNFIEKRLCYWCLNFVKLFKAHRQTSKKQCFEKYCSCDQACQFSALYGTPWWSYLENLTIDDKFINK